MHTRTQCSIEIRKAKKYNSLKRISKEDEYNILFTIHH
jgi:hypothetical protein